MATEKINLTAPEGPVGTIAEDAQTTTETINNSEIDALANKMSENFADEEAALAADEAGLEIGEETAEEEAASPAIGDDISGLSEAELVALFAQKIESEPVQTLRPVVEAIKIAFYKQHRAKVEAERKAYIEILKRLGTRLPILVGCDVIQCAQLLVQARRVIKIDIIGMDKALPVQHIHHTHNLRKVRAVIVVIRAYNHRSVTRRNEFERSLNRELLTEERTLSLLVGIGNLVVQLVRKLTQALIHLIHTRKLFGRNNKHCVQKPFAVIEKCEQICRIIPRKNGIFSWR